VGVIGWPVTHTLSPALHNAVFAHLGMNWRYVPMPVRESDLGAAVRGLAALGFRGANVTVPHKTAVIPLLNSVTDAVHVVGAVNTIRVDLSSGKIEGLNTDMSGFLTDLAASGVRVEGGTPVIILGAGGAARACAAGLVRSGAKVTLVNRTLDRAQQVAQFLRKSWPKASITAESVSDLPKLLKGVTLIVNATSVGLWPDANATPWPAEVPFPSGVTLYDTIYRPLKTRLMQDAEQAGARAIGGIGMLVYQGAAALEAWTGQPTPLQVMRHAAEDALGG
jgi:shikimate dehydrogenase